MNDDVKRAYQIVQNPYYQTVNEHPAVELVIENTDVITSRKGNNEQQRLASQRPRGTRIDDTGTRIQVKGGRNYTSRKLYISREEMFDDVVVRGLRADGLSTKLGVKNHKDGIARLLSELFHDDQRLSVIEEHFKTHRQKSNCAKTMFATMTHEELQFLKAETFPSRIDVQVRDYLTNTFTAHPQKLQATVEVLGQIQQIFKVLTPHADFLSNHNFQTRGFFLDIILMTCSFLMQIIQDSDGNPDILAKTSDLKDKTQPSSTVVINTEEGGVKENKTAAEILLSVGSDILDNEDAKTRSVHSLQLLNKGSSSKFGTSQVSGTLPTVLGAESVNINQTLPTTVVVEGTQKPDGTDGEECQWTTVEMVDGNGNSRYMLIKADNEDPESFNAVKILGMLQDQGVTVDENMDISSTSQDAVVVQSKPSTEDNVVETDAEAITHQTNKVTLELRTTEASDEVKSSPKNEVEIQTSHKGNQVAVESPDIDVVETSSIPDDVTVGGTIQVGTEDKPSDEILRPVKASGISEEPTRNAQKRKLDDSQPDIEKRSKT